MNKKKKDTPSKPQDLDSVMDSYWEKSGNPEVLARIAKEREDRAKAMVEKKAKAMDDVMDKYWADKKAKDEAPTDAADSILN